MNNYVQKHFIVEVVMNTLYYIIYTKLNSGLKCPCPYFEQSTKYTNFPGQVLRPNGTRISCFH